MLSQRTLLKLKKLNIFTPRLFDALEIHIFSLPLFLQTKFDGLFSKPSDCYI